MLDFKELPKDGEAFEQLMRELLFSYGMAAEWSGRGADGGRDLICRETLKGLIVPSNRTWLVQCKHFAHANRSVGGDDIDNVVDSCNQHKATGYLLACSTQPSSAVVNRLEGITNNLANQVTATFWDSVIIERLLSRPRHWAIAQRFFPVSAGAWLIYATERPNDFVAHFKGYVFHLTNRIGSSIDHLLPSVEARIAELETISEKLPKEHFIRPRDVWYDDKNGGFRWYIDYMYPNNSRPSVSKAQLAHALHDGWALEDGQIYSWDIRFVRYNPDSDHYDRDHYDYYVRYMPNFLEGAERKDDDADWERTYAIEEEFIALQNKAFAEKDSKFDRLVETFNGLDFLRVIRAVNAGVEYVAKFERRFVWSDIIDNLKGDVSQLFEALLIIEVEDEDKFHTLLTSLPNDVHHHFRVSRVYVYAGHPNEGLADKDSATMFDLKLSVHPAVMVDQLLTREAFNSYFDEIRAAIDQFSGSPTGGTAPVST